MTRKQVSDPNTKMEYRSVPKLNVIIMLTTLSLPGLTRQSLVSLIDSRTKYGNDIENLIPNRNTEKKPYNITSLTAIRIAFFHSFQYNGKNYTN